MPYFRQQKQLRDKEEELLGSDARPIVLLRWKSNIEKPLAEEVCAGSERKGRGNYGQRYNYLFHNRQNVMSTPNENVLE